jgi:hypothetical protein
MFIRSLHCDTAFAMGDMVTPGCAKQECPHCGFEKLWPKCPAAADDTHKHDFTNYGKETYKIAGDDKVRTRWRPKPVSATPKSVMAMFKTYVSDHAQRLFLDK